MIQTKLHYSKFNKIITDHRREVVALDFLDTEEERQQADIACCSMPMTDDETSASTWMVCDDTAPCRRQSANSSTGCTSWECVAPPTQYRIHDSTTNIMPYRCQILQSSVHTCIAYYLSRKIQSQRLYVKTWSNLSWKLQTAYTIST